MDISNLIKNQRKQLGLSQSDLARLADLSLPLIQNVESGKANPSLSTMLSLFKVLGWKLRLENDPEALDAFLDVFEGLVSVQTGELRRLAWLTMQYLLDKKSELEESDGREFRAKLALFVVSEQTVSLKFEGKTLDSVLEKSDSVLNLERKFWINSGGLRKARSLAAKIF